MKKVFFWCLETDETEFYSFVTDKNVEEYCDQDDILLEEGIIDDLQGYSTHGSLNNWGVIKIEDTDAEVSPYKVDDSLTNKEKSAYLTDKELKSIRKDKQIKSLKKKVAKVAKEDIHNMDSKSLKELYVEISEKLEKIRDKIAETENKEAGEKKAKRREELLKAKGFVSESGWIDRTGKYWNVQGVDHDEVAVLKWGSMWQAERSNIRISSTGFGLYILYSHEAKRPPNNKQFATLYRWAEHFGEQNKVSKFEKQMIELFED